MDAVLEPWREFNVAMTGAAAALAGLVIVAASVNISDIIKSASLTARLASGIAGLVLAITGAAIGLIPVISLQAYGIAMIAGGIFVSVFAGAASRRIYQNRHPENKLRALKSLLGFMTPLAYLAGGALVLAGAESGLVWFAIGSIIAIVAALLVSWIVLVEVLR